VPLAAIALQLVLAIFIVNVSWLAWVIGPSWIAAGLLIYFLYARTRAVPIREEIFAVDAPVVPSDGRFRILVPVADADQVLPLVPAMLRLAEASDGGVELVHLVAVPEQVPLTDAHRYALPGTEGEVEAGLYLPARRLVNSSILYCRNAARGILYQARAGGADLILLGWRGLESEAGRLFGRTLDQVLEQATCDVAVVRPGGKSPFLNVLVPVAGGPNSERALEIAGMLADPKRGTVTALHVQSARGQPLDVAAIVTKVCRESSMSCDRFCGRVLVSDDPRAVILREAATADLIVLGATEGRFRRLIAATLPGDIARSCDRPLVIVRAMGRRRRSRAV
jgi:basic amino acid/polyamine antiporter, APA family